MNIKKAVADKFRSLNDSKIYELVSKLGPITIETPIGSVAFCEWEKEPAKEPATSEEVLEFLVNHTGGTALSAAEISALSGYDKKDVLKAMAALCESGRCVKTGEKRGTKYAAVRT